MPSTTTRPPVGLTRVVIDADGGRLAGAVGAEQAEDLALGDREVDARHRLGRVGP